METLFAFFMLASIVVAVMALFRRSPVRRWFRSRQHPRRAVVVTTVLWLIAAVILVPKTPAEPTATRAEAPPRSTAPSRPSPEPAPTQTTAPTKTAGPTTTDPGTTERTTKRASAPAGVPADAQRVRVERVVDGDTLEAAAVSAGGVLASTAQVDVRLLQIDAPETKHPSEPEQCYGREATEKLLELAPPGGTIWVQRDEELRDRYGRYLLYVWNHTGVFVNKAMVTEGFAQPELYEPNDKHWPAIRDAGGQARSVAAGLWSACASFGAPEDTQPTSTTPEPAPEPSSAPQPRQQPEQPAPGSEPASEPDGVVSYPYPPDKDCSEIDESHFRVQEGDPHEFDADDDGIGCDS
ncbi:thermonuclease family protein [Prauserella alba]|uniref:thermonuclease family protein n=1 Tax=Prauserella alba TaxID=176898 RepID=UPI0020A3489A|nr:thermonuclease family protein [Prauserella alba]